MTIDTPAQAQAFIENLATTVATKLAEPGVSVRQLVRASLRALRRDPRAASVLVRSDIDTLTAAEIAQGLYAELGGRRVTMSQAADLAALWT